MASAGKRSTFADTLKDSDLMDGRPFSLAQPFRPGKHRCKRRWTDYVRLSEMILQIRMMCSRFHLSILR